MACQVKWTKNASEDLFAVLEYLKDKWPEDVVTHFIERLFVSIDQLKSYPLIGKSYSDAGKIRSFVITKQITCYYYSEKKAITILGLFDTRQSPETKKY